MKLLTKEKCPGCKHEFDSEHELEHIEPIRNVGKIEKVESTEKPKEPEVKIEEKIIEKTKIPADQPFYECKNCDSMHKNKNYSTKPSKKCTNCGSLNGPKNKGCKNCANAEFEDVSEDDLNEWGVPEPELAEHEHEPTE